MNKEEKKMFRRLIFAALGVGLVFFFVSFATIALASCGEEEASSSLQDRQLAQEMSELTESPDVIVLERHMASREKAQWLEQDVRMLEMFGWDQLQPCPSERDILSELK
ncbi:MAG TPA: hypothetical protein VF817_03430 [Patescibacteria group bacterium]